jgi:hypothetical protein
MQKLVINIFSFAVVIFSLSCEEDKSSVNEGLQVYYSFDDGDTGDQTGNNPDGVVNGASLTIDRNGKGDSAYFFNSVADEIILGNILDGLKEPFTVSAWAKPLSQNNTCVLTSQDDLTVYGGFYFFVGKNSFALMTGDGAGKTLANRRTKSTFSLPEMTNTWNHYCAVVKAVDNIELYVNGIKVVSNFDSGEGLGTESNFPQAVARVGRMNETGFVSTFEGGIDEIKVWNRALNASEVKEAMK